MHMNAILQTNFSKSNFYTQSTDVALSLIMYIGAAVNNYSTRWLQRRWILIVDVSAIRSANKSVPFGHTGCQMSTPRSQICIVTMAAMNNVDVEKFKPIVYQAPSPTYEKRWGLTWQIVSHKHLVTMPRRNNVLSTAIKIACDEFEWETSNMHRRLGAGSWRVMIMLLLLGLLVAWGLRSGSGFLDWRGFLAFSSKSPNFSRFWSKVRDLDLTLSVENLRRNSTGT